MGAPEILTQLRSLGLTLTVRREKLRIEPKSKITDETRFLVRDSKDDLLAYLCLSSEASHERATAIACQDDRRRCTQCLNLRREICIIAKPERGALVVASRGYRPVNLLLRCAGYTPKPNDTDQRTGVERWTNLTETFQ